MRGSRTNNKGTTGHNTKKKKKCLTTLESDLADVGDLIFSGTEPTLFFDSLVGYIQWSIM
jgi:hypothetical protein